MKRTTTILLIAVAVASAILLQACDKFQADSVIPQFKAEAVHDTALIQVQVIERDTVIIRDPVAPPRVPEYVVFAGDTIRFDDGDLRERMDRELIAFTYTHSNTILMLKRANRIFPQVEPLLKAQGVPDDLKYLMAIESNLSETAVSTASAAGLWQFMKATATEYGLEVAATVDERYSIRKETVAACKMLKKLYDKFGDWMTVAAAYNSGAQNVSKRLSSQKVSKAMDLALVEETSRYMFRILVAKIFFEDPSQFGFKLQPKDFYPYVPPVRTVTVSSSIDDLADFAKRNGVTYYQLKRANPWLRDMKLTAKKGATYEIAIPDIRAERYNPDEIVLHNPAWAAAAAE